MNRRDFMRGTLGLAATAGMAAVNTSGVFAQAAPVVHPELVGIDETGRKLGLADFDGKACLVSFFTSGCNLCLNDLKLMREFNRDNRARSFAMLAVCLDDARNDYMDYARLIALSVPAQQRFPLLWRKAPEHRDTFGPIVSMPTHFVLNKSHALTLTRKGSFKPDDWDELWTLLG